MIPNKENSCYKSHIAEDKIWQKVLINVKILGNTFNWISIFIRNADSHTCTRICNQFVHSPNTSNYWGHWAD